MEIEKIRQAVRENKVIITYHARRQMGLRKVYPEEAIQVILNGRIVEQYPRAKPYPKYLVMAFVRENEPLYVSLGFTGEWVIIITVHWYDPRKWIDPWTRRKKQ